MYVVIFLAIFGCCYADDKPTDVEIKSAASAVTEFSLDLLKKVHENGKNVFFSGYSIAVALGMVSLGARGDTLAEIDKTFHFAKVNANDPKAIHKVFKACIEFYSKPNPNYTLSTANRLFGQDSFKIEQNFQDDVKNYYHGELQQLDFTTHTAEGIINDWVAKQTHNKIQNLFPKNSLDANTVLVLVNAIYFKGNWQLQFKKDATVDEKFSVNKTDQILVKMMTQTGHFNYYADSNLKVKVLELPYVGKDLSMFIVLPDEIDGLPALIKSLTATVLDTLLSSVQDTNVQVKLPKFKLEAEYALVEVLTELGVRNLFDEKCNLSSIVSDEIAHLVSISDIVHKAFVLVDEEGTEAAAATGVISIMRSAPRVEITKHFHVDHPFLFVLRDNEHQMDLFLGQISKVPEFTKESVEDIEDNINNEVV